MLVIVGLGNPGPEYIRTRHNAGFLCLDDLQDRFALPPFAAKMGGLLSHDSGQQVMLFKPLSYMNLSGGPVQRLLAFYRLTIDDIVVLHDELDLPSGTLRMKKGGGNAGHNGLKSLTQNIGNEFWRIRLGIGRPNGAQPAHDYVLGHFRHEELEDLAVLSDKVADVFPLLKEKNFEHAQETINK